MQNISSEDIVQRIRTENPWWSGTYTVSEFNRQMEPRAYFSLFLPLVRNRSVKRAVILMGPRRVGKTVMIRHAVKALMDAGVPPKSICYFSVDHPIYDGLSLEKMLEYYSQASSIDFRSEQIYVFFDEIQYLRKWEVHLKSVVDAYSNIKCIASGSAAAALRLKSTESGTGRFTDFLLPPLTFHEYLSLLGKTDLVREAEGHNDERYFTAVDIEQVNREFVQYLNIGGYPEVIFSPSIQSDPARFIKSDIIDKVLLRDLPSLYGIDDIQELNHLFTTLAFNTAYEVSLGELSKNSGVAKNTIKRYMEYLEAAFLIKLIHRIDQHAKRFQRANFFKAYLTNPSMRAALFSPLKTDDPALPYLIETSIFSKWFHDNTALFYARWADGGEVDMVHLDPKPRWVVEVKWSDRYCDNAEELKSLLSFCRLNKLKNVLVTSKTKTAKRNVGEVPIEFLPASLYCYTVGYNVVAGKVTSNDGMLIHPQTGSNSA